MRKKTGLTSRNKGKTGERELCDLLRQYGFKARRAQQFKGNAGDEDITHDMEGFHIECKRVEQTNFWAWLDQADDDALDGNDPVVFHRPNSKPWIVFLYADDFLAAIRPLFDTVSRDSSIKVETNEDPAEFEIARLFKRHGFEDFRLKVKAGLHFHKALRDAIDGFYMECRRTERLSLWSDLLGVSERAGDNIPILFHRNRERTWVTIMFAEDFLALVSDLYE